MEPLFDVAVVGFGPTGATMAALLGQAGLRVFACDAQRRVFDKPRAVALDHEILRVFQQIGIGEAVAAHIEPFTDSRFLGADGQLIKCMTTVAPPYPLAHPPSVVFSQPAVERVLRDRVRSLPGVEVALGAELVDVAADESAVKLQLRGDDGDSRRVQARWAIGCDGASSRVRGLAGIGLEDLGFDEPWLVIDVLANERGLARLPTTSMQYCEPDRPCSFIIGPGRHRRWEISLKDGEDPKRMATPEGAWAALARWIGPDDGTLWRQASYRFHALVAERWRAGRVFVAGDAAHQQPPFLGQGLCQGVRDAANLAWKLAAVQCGAAGEALLDSYGRERGAHVRQLTARIKGIGAVICERDPARARARDAALLAACGGVVRPEARQDVQPRLESGLLDVARFENDAHDGKAAGSEAPADRASGNEALASRKARNEEPGDSASGREASASRGAGDPVGTLFPQPWVDVDGRRTRLDDLVGTGWRLVLRAEAASTFEAVARTPGLEALDLRVVRIGRCDGPSGRPEQRVPEVLHECEGVVAAWFDRHRCEAAIVRPDHYVHAVADSPEALSRSLHRLRDRLLEGADNPKENAP